MATFKLSLAVALKVGDNEARSALEALRAKMDLEDEVRDLACEELWELEVEAPSAERAQAIVRELVETTNLFANPNKHRFSLALDDGSSGGGDLDEDEIAILVSDRESTESASILSAIRRHGTAGVVCARKWVRWRVRLTRAPSPEQPGLLPLIRRIGVATSRRDGLLSNPHSQIARAAFPWGDEKPLAG